MKKTIAMLLALVMIFALAACGQSAAPAPAPAEKPAEAAPAEAVPAAEAEPAGPALKDKYIIGFSKMYGTDIYIMCIEDGLKDQAKVWEEKLGVEIEIVSVDAGNDDPTQQQADLEDLAVMGVDGVVIFPGDSDLIVTPIKELYNANNIPVVITDVGVSGGELLSYIVTSQYEFGCDSGQMLVDAMTEAGTVDGGKVVGIQTHPANASAVARVDGFMDVCAAAGCEVLETKIPESATVDACYKVTEDLLTSDPDLAGIFTVNNIAVVGIAMALKDHNRPDVKLVGNDGSAAMYDLILDGTYCYGSAMQQPYLYGTLAMDQLMYYFTGETDKIQAEINPEAILVTKANIEQYKDNPLFAG